MHILNDTVEMIGKPRITDAGYMVVESAVARVGVQEYYAAELGDLFADLPANQIVRLDRPAEVVFSDESMASYAHKPVTNDHPREAVNAANWKRYSVGHVGDEVKQEGKFIRVPMMVTDGDTIAAIDNGKREWSAGYGVTMVRDSGINADGEAYDARITSQVINHIALVDKGRAGSECRIVDKQGGAPVATEKMIVDGVPIDVTDAAKAVIEKLQTQVKDSEKAVTELKAAHDVADAKKDAEIADLQAKVAELGDESKIVARIEAKAALLADAKLVHDADYANMDENAIRRAAVLATVGDSVKDKSDDYIAARFDALRDAAKAEDGKKDDLRAKIADSKQVNVSDARADYIARFTGSKEAK